MKPEWMQSPSGGEARVDVKPERMGSLRGCQVAILSGFESELILKIPSGCCRSFDWVFLESCKKKNAIEFISLRAN